MSDGRAAIKRRPGRPQSLTDSAKKRKKKDLDTKSNRSRINIGEEIDRWNTFRERNGLKSNSEVAKILLDSHDSDSVQQRVKKFLAPTSTPAVKPSKWALLETLPDVSEISSEENDNHFNIASDVSGVHALSDNDLSYTSPGEPQCRKDPAQQKTTETSSIYVNPFEISVDISDQIYTDTDDDESDEDYEPSVNITLGPANMEGIPEVSFAEADFGVSSDEEEEVDEGGAATECPTGSGVKRILSAADQEALTSDEAYLMYLTPVIELAQLHVPRQCSTKGCGQEVDIQSQSVGSALYLKWICKNGHLLYKWCSQRLLNYGLHGGDFLIAAAILLSGNNYSKIATMAKFLRLHFVSSSSFQRMQTTYLVPAIETFWDSSQAQLLEEFKDEKLVLLGDGRMDSPGHSAQYCSYTMMENSTKKIVTLETMDKRRTGLKSSVMEKECLIKAIDSLTTKQLDIGEIVTDAHMQISALMKKSYPAIKHSYDIWHAAKNIGKKIAKAGQEKSCKELLPWTRHIVNHFWHATQIAESYKEFMGIWSGVLHHVLNEHEWLFNYGSGSNRCSHGPLAEDREAEWLKKGSKAHQALVRIVMDRRLLNNVQYFLNFRSTAELENFQNLILMYASKRYAYEPPVYRARNLLAALDYNQHVNRGIRISQAGNQGQQRKFNKKSGRWSVTEVKNKKTYDHIPDLISLIVRVRLEDKEGMHKKVALKPDDPRLISKTLAPVPPPPTSQLVLEKKSRLKKESESLFKN